MSNTSRNLMGTTVASKPAVAAASAPRDFTDDTQDPAITGNPDNTGTPQAPVHDWEKRYKDLQSFHTKSMATKETELSEARSHNQPNQFQVPKTAEELSAFSKDNPETFQFIQTIAHDIAAKQVEPIVGRLQDTEADLATERQDKAFNELMVKHPDFEKVDASPEFHTWLSSQPDHIQGWIFNNPDDAGKISSVLDLFKSTTGWGVNTGNTSAAQSVASQAAQAIDTGSTSSGETQSSNDPRLDNPQYIWSENEIGRMHPSEYSKFSDAIDLAMSEGRIKIGQ